MEINALQSKISYLASCFKADNRELRITDIFNANKVENLLVMDGNEELINQDAPKIAIPSDKAIEMLKIKQLFEKEKELLYCSLFIVGQTEELGKQKKVCAPLLLFPADIKAEGEHHFLYIRGAEWRVNESALQLLFSKGDSSFDSLALVKELPTFPFGYGEMGVISRLLKKFMTRIDTEAVLMYPQIWNEKKIKRQLQPKQLESIDFFKVIPGSAVGIVSKSSATFGILSELEELQQQENYSKALLAAFGVGAMPKTIDQHLESIALPTVPSEAQKSAIINARHQTLSMIVGPPGTGKSFTIACIALDHLKRGESVLITSRHDEAVNVVGKKIEHLLGTSDIIARGGTNYMWQMRKQLRKILSNKLSSEANTADHNRDFRYYQAKVKELESSLSKRLQQELDWSERLTGYAWDDKLMSSIIKTFHGWYTPHWKLLEELEKNLQKRNEVGKEFIISSYIEGVRKILQSNRDQFEKLYQSLVTYTSSERDELFYYLDFKTLLKAIPIWLCNVTDLYRIMPFRKELYDVVIIDEASQCDMATVLPALQRAKRVVVVGDPNQLRHASFLSSEKMVQLLQQSNLDSKLLADLNFREMSFLDFLSRQIVSQDQVSFLDEHFRSVPDIIRFSNSAFYSDSLRVMTQKPVKNPNAGNFIHKVNGTRNSKGQSEVEAQTILEKITDIIDEESELPNEIKSTIGVLSPLRSQVDFLFKLISKSFKYEVIQAHDIQVGTAYSFQGEERDIMLLSFAVDDDSHSSAFVHINKPDVFNVSLTRAKSKQLVYHSLSVEKLPMRQYLRSFLEQSSSSDIPTKDQNHEHDTFLQEVLEFLKPHFPKYWISFSIAGLPIDILVQTTLNVKGIDLIGYPGIYRDALSVERFKILSRAGVPIFPLGYSFWTLQRETCKEELLKFLGRVN